MSIVINTNNSIPTFDEKIIYSEEKEQRLKAYGVLKFYTKKDNFWELKDEYKDINKILKFFEEEMWKSSDHLKTHTIKKYSADEVKECLHFIACTLIFTEGNELLKPIVKMEVASTTDNVEKIKEKLALQAQAERDKIIEKFKKMGDLLWKVEINLEVPKKQLKKRGAANSVKFAREKLEKIIDKHMSVTDRTALDKPLKKAFKILKEYEKQLK